DAMRWRRPYNDFVRLSLYPLALVLVLALIYTASTGDDGPSNQMVEVLGLGSVFAVLLVLWARMGIFVSEHGVRVRNLFRSTTVAWTQIRGPAEDRHEARICFQLADGSILVSPVQCAGGRLNRYAPTLSQQRFDELQDRLSGLIASRGSTY